MKKNQTIQMELSNNSVALLSLSPRAERPLLPLWNILIAKLNQSPLLWVIGARVSTPSESGEETAGRDVCRQAMKELFTGFYQDNHIKRVETFNQLGRTGYYHPGSPLFSLATIKHYGLRRRRELAFENHSGKGTLVETVDAISLDSIINTVT